MHFDQLCTHERCLGYWGLRIESGFWGDLPLHGLRAILVYDSPQHMISGGWTETLLIDEAATPPQRLALEAILKGQAGGPWEVLARFVAHWQPTRFVPIAFTEDEVSKTAAVPGLLKSVITRLRGRDKSKPVLFENIFNQIHASTQVLATGETEYDDGLTRMKFAKTHGLYSNFEWRVEAGA
jgi:hypothetical protein